MKTFYTITELKLANGSVFNVFSGETVEAEECPKSASPWQPAVAGKGMQSYHDGTGWFVRRDISALTFAELQSFCLASAVQTYEEAMIAINADYSDSEIKSFSMQLSAAQSVLAGDGNSLIDALAAARGEDAEAVAQKIVDKSKAHTEAITEALAALHKSRKAISAATEVADLPLITTQDLRDGMPF